MDHDNIVVLIHLCADPSNSLTPTNNRAKGLYKALHGHLQPPTWSVAPYTLAFLGSYPAIANDFNNEVELSNPPFIQQLWVISNLEVTANYVSPFQQLAVTQFFLLWKSKQVTSMAAKQEGFIPPPKVSYQCRLGFTQNLGLICRTNSYKDYSSMILHPHGSSWCLVIILMICDFDGSGSHLFLFTSCCVVIIVCG